jgi:hypothetical protein
MLSQRMLDCDQRDNRRFARIPSNAAANFFAARTVRPQLRHQIVGQFSLIQIASHLTAGSTGLRSEESPYPLRT